MDIIGSLKQNRGLHLMQDTISKSELIAQFDAGKVEIYKAEDLQRYIADVKAGNHAFIGGDGKPRFTAEDISKVGESSGTSASGDKKDEGGKYTKEEIGAANLRKRDADLQEKYDLSNEDKYQFLSTGSHVDFEQSKGGKAERELYASSNRDVFKKLEGKGLVKLNDNSVELTDLGRKEWKHRNDVSETEFEEPDKYLPKDSKESKGSDSHNEGKTTNNEKLIQISGKETKSDLIKKLVEKKPYWELESYTRHNESDYKNDSKQDLLKKIKIFNANVSAGGKGNVSEFKNEEAHSHKMDVNKQVENWITSQGVTASDIREFLPFDEGRKMIDEWKKYLDEEHGGFIGHTAEEKDKALDKMKQLYQPLINKVKAKKENNKDRVKATVGGKKEIGDLGGDSNFKFTHDKEAKQKYSDKTVNGFKWIGSENGVHSFSKREDDYKSKNYGKYQEIKVGEHQIHNGDLEYMAQHGLTSDDESQKDIQKKYKKQHKQ